MSAPIIRRAVQLLPSCASTGIGSMPHTQVEMGLQAALALDIPFLPQMPMHDASEYMIPSAIEGLPGLSFDEDGICTVDLAKWEAGRAAFEAKLETALSTGALEAFEPTPEACRAWLPFLWEVENRKLRLAKAQIAGPFTVLSVVRTSDGRTSLDVPGLDQMLYRLVMARSLAMVKALRRTGATPLFFLDEPGLYALQRTQPRHLMVLQELKLLTVALQREGALVGIHCCGNTDWAALLDVQPDLLSLDVRLSLDAMLEETEALQRFLGSGSALCLGIIPTDLTSTYDVAELTDSVEASLKAALPKGHSFTQTLAHMMLTPACGLAMRSVQDAERVLGELRAAQRRLHETLDTERGPEFYVI